MNNKTEKSPFKAAPIAAIKTAIKNAKAEGTVGMGLDNLKAVTRVPAGAPLGTNARYYYNEAFNEVAAEAAGSFLLPPVKGLIWAVGSYGAVAAVASLGTGYGGAK
jgi:hypothetical protein